MLLKRRKTNPVCSGADDGRPSSMHSSNGLFRNGYKLVVKRAPLMNGLSCGSSSLMKPFQRPVIKRRAQLKAADEALRKSSLGQRRRLDGMAKLQARAGRGLGFKLSKRPCEKDDTGSSSDEEDEEEEEEQPFEPLMVWQSPHQGGECKGLPSRMESVVRTDEFGVEETVTVMQPAPIAAYSKNDVFVPPILTKWLRKHQREGVQFIYQCVMGLKDYNGNGCVLADDMGLGKTLQSVTLIYTLLKTSITAKQEPTAKRVIVVCPCSLVKNWENEFVKWLGPGGVKTLAIAEADRKTVEKNLDVFAKTRLFQILICSYECLRAHVKRLTKYKDCCDLLVCDEAHRLKNSENQTSRALDSLPVQRRVLLTGTPMQNDLNEFYAMVSFTNRGVLGSPEEFRRKMMNPILRGREPDATESQKQRMQKLQNDMSSIVNDFILRRVNTINAQHLPPKLVQVVCCNLTEVQLNMYQHLITSKDMQHVMDGKQVNCLGSIQMLMKLCNHPSLVVDDDPVYGGKQKSGRRAATKQVKYTDDEPTSAAPGADGIAKFLPASGGGGRGSGPVHPEWSGKMFVLYRLMKEMRKPGNGNDKIVIVSNYTQTLDLIGLMCRENSWGFCRLDGSITMKKRQKMVDDFNDPGSSLIAFLLSSKAGGCGLNLIGGNRLVLFDPDWNPAVDKQAAARCWRDGQKKRCFTYRFLATGTVEEKIFQRQLSKEGLQSVVDDKEQVNSLSTKDLRNLFKFRAGTPSDTHDKLCCERCQIIQDNAELEAKTVLPMKLAACRDLLDKMWEQEEAHYFHTPLNSQDHGVSKDAYEKAVKQPMDLGTIKSRLAMSEDQPSSYKSVSGVSKDVNRIFSNVMKVWAPGDTIAEAAGKLQSWWIGQWTELVPILMTMKSDSDASKGNGNDDADTHQGMIESYAALNERGDDYQEQIGMPEEENMRSWSHHHSVDTVDDPIFRAAMKGYDSVSFVFGLEVTWSLIQEKNKEEEERMALKELEAAQELNQEGFFDNLNCDANDDAADKGNDDDDDDDEAQSDSSSDASNDAPMVDATLGHDKSENDTEEREESDGENTFDEEESSGGSVEGVPPPQPQDQEEEGNESSDDDSQDAEMVDSSDESATARSIETKESASSKRAGEKENENPVPKDDEWACHKCTFLNPNSAQACGTCNTERRSKAGRKRSVRDTEFS